MGAQFTVSPVLMTNYLIHSRLWPSHRVSSNDVIIDNFDQAPTSANFIALNKISIEPTIML